MDFMSTILIVTVINLFNSTIAEVIVKHFPITKNKTLDASGTLIIQSKSVVSCVVRCSVTNLCCTGSYNGNTKQCILSTNCQPSLLPSSSAIMFKRDIPDVTIQNGAAVISGDTAEVTCNTGYTLCGESSLTYTASGIWNHPYPVCVGTDKTMSFGGKTYEFVTISATQQSALAYCTGKGSYLLDITSADENSFIKCVTYKFNNGIGWWIGLTAFTSGTYTWHSGEPVTYTNWVSPPYLTDQGSCAKFNQGDGFWYERSSSSCTYSLPFVCKS